MNPFESLLTGNVVDDVSLVHKAEPPDQPESPPAACNNGFAMGDNVASAVVEHLLDSYSDKALQEILSGVLQRRPQLHKPLGDSLHRKVKPCPELEQISSYHYDEEERTLITRIQGGSGMTVSPWEVPQFVSVETAALLVGSEQAFLTSYRKKCISNQETRFWRIESAGGTYAIQKSRASASWEVLLLE